MHQIKPQAGMRRTITVEFLADQDISGWDITDLVAQGVDGDVSMLMLGEVDVSEWIDGKQLADALVAQGSDPGFLGVDPSGHSAR